MVLSFLLLSCSPGNRIQNTSKNRKEGIDEAWLNGDHIEPALDKEYALVFGGGEESARRERFLLEARERADIVLEFGSSATLRVQQTKLDVGFPNDFFPARELSKYLLNRPDPKPIALAVILLPEEISADPGQPALLAAIRSLDVVLQEAGVKDRMLQSDCYNRVLGYESPPDNKSHH